MPRGPARNCKCICGLCALCRIRHWKHDYYIQRRRKPRAVAAPRPQEVSDAELDRRALEWLERRNSFRVVIG